MGERYPAFSLTEPLYDMTTYRGRVQYFFSAVNPKQMIQSDAAIAASQSLLDSFKNNSLDRRKVSDQDLWEARMTVDACVHPATNEPIFPLFRFAAFCPVNFVMVPLMLLPSTIRSPARTIGMHWLNQSYNCAVNYANRSSEGMSPIELMPAYVGAVTTSIGLGLGGTFLMTKIPSGSAMATAVRAVVPFTAVAASGCANLAITRRKEWMEEGVALKDASGKLLDCPKSKNAAFEGLKLCAAARVIWNVPCMVLPPLVAAPWISMFPGLFAQQAPRMMLDCLCCNLGTGLGVPPSLAIFPPTVKINVSDLEPEIQEILAKSKPEIQEVFFYKGL